jgi:hypothetical protein
VAYGISRGGYLASRLLAADARVAGVAAIAPVTDWRLLTEFTAERGSGPLGELRLSRYVKSLVGKRVFLVIGNSDQRVSSESCALFFSDLMAENARAGQAKAPVEFHCQTMAEAGHVVDDFWRRRGAEFLLAGD